MFFLFWYHFYLHLKDSIYIFKVLIFHIDFVIDLHYYAFWYQINLLGFFFYIGKLFYILVYTKRD